jgi:hypothetical protein
MPDASPLDHETACPAIPSVDAFFARVVHGVHWKLARVRREERLTGVPHRFSCCLRETSRLTGLPVPMLRTLCRAREIAANKISG